MGVVVSARHIQLGQTVAIKTADGCRRMKTGRDEAIARFLNEAQAAAKLRGDHVVRIYDVGQLESGLPFMVMELLSGSDLGSILDERGALPEAEAVDYVLQACAGVSEAPQMGIVHRRPQAFEPVRHATQRRLAAAQGARLRHLETAQRPRLG